MFIPRLARREKMAGLFVHLKLLVLTCFALLVSFALNAQRVPQNLFSRSQFLEQYKRNFPRRNTSRPDIFKCRPPAPIASRWFKGETLYNKNSWTDAAKLYSTCIYQDSSFCDAYFRLVQCYSAMDELADALNLLRLAQEKFPNDPKVYLGLGQLHLMLWAPQEALLNYDRMIGLDANDADGYLGASIALYEMDRSDEALNRLEKGKQKLILEISSASAPQASVNEDDGIPAGIKARRLKGLETMLYPLLYYEAILYYETNQTEKSLEHLKSIEPNRGEMEGWRRYYLGLCYLAKGEHYYSRAKENLQIATQKGIKIDPIISETLGLHIDPTDFKSMALLEFYDDDFICEFSNKELKAEIHSASSDLENRKFSHATKSYIDIIQKDSLNCKPYVKLAECYQLQGHPMEALGIYRLAHQKFPNEKTIGLLLARQYLKVDSLTSSLRAYNEVIHLDSADYRGYYGASLVLAHMGEKKGAVLCLRSSERHFRHIPRKIACLEGALYYQVGNRTFALQYLLKATEFEPRGPIANYYLALYYSSMGREFRDQSRNYLLTAIESGAKVNPPIEKNWGSILKFAPRIVNNNYYCV